MFLTLNVALLSGKTASVQAELDDTVEAVKVRAQTALGVGKGRVVNASGNVLDACSTIKDARLHDGDSLTLHINRVQVQANYCAFAAILGDGSVATRGIPVCGGDSGAVKDLLKGVQQIQATDNAFAAILGDGSVVTWGASDDGGDSKTVQDQLKSVQHIQASLHAFAAILGDGSV